jgi:tetraacyldisaccharide 4'-kinase
VDSARAAEGVWQGRGPGAALARAALLPFEALYRMAVAARGALYDAGVLPALHTSLPAIGVGNLTVGGTGKTPVSAWMARELLARGARPAVVLRGYGGDEPLVHAALNPGVPVVAAADRIAGVHQARAVGADVAVLDDAFQHRRARRVADVVLVSADRRDGRDGRTRLLPAGPWREPPTALRRASLALVTRKAAGPGDALATLRWISMHAPKTPTAVASLELGPLRRAPAPHATDDARDPERPLSAANGARILAVSAIGDPRAFRRQLEAIGARVDAATYGDHHRYAPSDVRELTRRARAADLVVCTLKDAVKLGPLWPREAPALWYVTQRVTIERGWEELDRVLETVLAARPRPPLP